MTKDKIIKAIESSGSMSEASGKLKISRQWLDKLLKKHNLRVTKSMKVHETIP